jgi:hypothetical protein
MKTRIFCRTQLAGLGYNPAHRSLYFIKKELDAIVQSGEMPECTGYHEAKGIACWDITQQYMDGMDVKKIEVSMFSLENGEHVKIKIGEYIPGGYDIFVFSGNKIMDIVDGCIAIPVSCFDLANDEMWDTEENENPKMIGLIEARKPNYLYGHMGASNAFDGKPYEEINLKL